MAAEDVLGQLTAIRVELEHAYGTLISPTPPVLDDCANAIQRVTHLLASYQPSLKTLRQNSGALAEAHQLRDLTGRTRKLLQIAWHFHARWAQIRGIMTAGYTAAGEAATAPCLSRIRLQG
jgi:hypothetical protein